MNSPYKSVKHNTYFHVYDLVLGHLYGKNITFIEIGILDGGSLFMWKELFGPNSRIIGIDLNPEANRWKDHGFEIFIGDQANPDFWLDTLNTIGSFDVLLDDGGHLYNQQIITVDSALKNVKDEGIIIVEDTHTSYMDGFGTKRFSFVEYSFEIINRINHRSSAVKKPELAECRVFSVHFFESIVAFYIDKEKSREQSYPTVNLGIDNFSQDFRLASQPNLLKRVKRMKIVFPGSSNPELRRYLSRVVTLTLKSVTYLSTRILEKFDASYRLSKKLFRR